MVLHQLHQLGDRLGAELPGPLGRERVGLVDEQHAADRPVDDGLHLERGLADVAGDEVGPRHLDEVPLRHQPDAAVQPGDDPGHGRLAGPGVAGEDDVQAGAHLGESGLATLDVEQVDGQQLAHGRLDRRRARSARRARPGSRRSSPSWPGPASSGSGSCRRSRWRSSRGRRRRGRGRAVAARRRRRRRIGRWRGRGESRGEVEDPGLRGLGRVDQGQLRLGLGGHDRCRVRRPGRFEVALDGLDRYLGRGRRAQDMDQPPQHVPQPDLGVRVGLRDRDGLVPHPVADHSDGSV